MAANRSYLIGKSFKRFQYTVSSEWIEEFRGITCESPQPQTGAAPTVPYSLLSVITMNICQQLWFDLATEIDASWTEDTLMLGEQHYRSHLPLLADTAYEVSNEIVRVEQKQGRLPFETVTFETALYNAAGETVFVGTNSFIVVD